MNFEGIVGSPQLSDEGEYVRQVGANMFFDDVDKDRELL
jgi:hypothetical protein